MHPEDWKGACVKTALWTMKLEGEGMWVEKGCTRIYLQRKRKGGGERTPKPHIIGLPRSGSGLGFAFEGLP